MRLMLLLLSCSIGLAQNPADLMAFHQILWPTQVAGLKLWFHPNSGIYKDAGITPAADGDSIQQWNDASGGGYNATENTASRRPVYRAGAINGFAAVDTGVTAHSDLTNRSIGSVSGHLTLIVLFYTTNGTGNVVVTDNPLIGFTASAGELFLNQGGPSVGHWDVQTSPGAWYLATGITRIVGETANIHWPGSELFVDGRLHVRGTSANYVPLTYVRLGDFVGTSLAGMIAEVMLYTRVLSENERIGLENGLKFKYALQPPF